MSSPSTEQRFLSDRELARRKELRLREFDYRERGYFFVTICTRDRVCCLSKIVADKVLLLSAGEIVLHAWNELPVRFEGLGLDSFVVMPNHLHALLSLGGLAGPTPSAISRAPSVKPPSLGEIVRSLKAVSTRLIRAAADPSFAWQANYFEHVIRDDRDFNDVRAYIEGNPAKWGADEFYR